ncbi:MAG: glycosyltransferase family 4 protein [Gammaproteobacteria bacterium]|nr:glycosyltransferase family 4 protein [Gammaproteobacteria bacterium]
MPRILIVQPSAPAYRRRFFECLAAEADVELLCSESSLDGAGSDLAGVNCRYEIVPQYCIGRRAAWQPGLVSKVLRDPPEILVINGNPRYISSMIAMFVARLRRVPVVWWGHAVSATSVPRRAAWRYRLMRMSTRIFVYYPEEIARLPDNLKQRAVGLDNSFDTSASLAVSDSLSRHDIEVFRTAASLTAPLILTIGRLTAKARIDILLDAMRLLKDDNFNLQLAILGGGELQPYLRDRVREVGLTEEILFVGKIFDENEIGRWMRASQLFVYGGAVGLSLLHAFSYGLPAVISSPLSSHMPEALLFRDGEHGALFESRNPQSLAATIKRVLSNPEQLDAMGARAQQLVRDRLSVEKMAQNFLRGLAGLSRKG